MWWQDLLWGLWNGITAWIVLIVHVFGGWDQRAFYNTNRNGDLYNLGFLMGVTMVAGIVRDLMEVGERRGKR